MYTLAHFVSNFQLQAEPERVGSVQCDVCELVVKLVEQEVINNKTEVRF